MANSRAKGYRFEAAIVDYLTERGWSADRMDQRVVDNDRPDLLALFSLSPWTATVLKLEAKNRKSTPVSLLISALAQAKKAKGPGLCVAAIKVAGKPTEDSLAVLRLEDLARLVELAGVKESDGKKD
jgi:Holliday junction resolvase